MPINNTTPNQGYQLPDGTNTLAYDVTRLINAITSIDSSVTLRPLFSNVTYVGTTSIALNRTSANQSLTGITSIDGSAATLTTAQTFWGQSFNGSAAVSGNLTAVGNITGSGAISLTTAAATNLSLTAGTTGSVTLDSGTTGAINIGTGASTKTITLGSSTGTVQLPTAVTKVGQTSLVQGGIVNVTLPTLAGTLVGSGDTGTVTSTMILDGTIVNADINASAAIAGTKISPNFGSQNTTTTGTETAANFISGAGTVTANGIQVGTGTTYKPGIYSPGTDQLAISTGGTSRIVFDASGNVNFDNNTFYVDAANNRVGLGTPGPTESLHTTGALRVTGAQTAAGTGIYLDQTSGVGNVSVYGPDASTQGTFRIYTATSNGSTGSVKFTLDSSGRVVIGTIASPANQLQVSTDSAGKPATSTWTIVSDERIKEDIELADLDLCYEAIKAIPLKRYKWRDEIYTAEQVTDRRKLGWIAQDVETVFPKAVGTHEFKYNQVFEETIIPAVEEELDADGNVITPAQPERTEQGDLISEDVIEDCRNLNSDQIYAAMYGAVQKLMAKVETLEASNADMLARLSVLESA